MASSTYVPAPSRPTAAAAEDPVLVSKIIRPPLPGWVVGRPRIDKLIAQANSYVEQLAKRPQIDTAPMRAKANVITALAV